MGSSSCANGKLSLGVPLGLAWVGLPKVFRRITSKPDLPFLLLNQALPKAWCQNLLKQQATTSCNCRSQQTAAWFHIRSQHWAWILCMWWDIGFCISSQLGLKANKLHAHTWCANDALKLGTLQLINGKETEYTIAFSCVCCCSNYFEAHTVLTCNLPFTSQASSTCGLVDLADTIIWMMQPAFASRQLPLLLALWKSSDSEPSRCIQACL